MDMGQSAILLILVAITTKCSFGSEESGIAYVELRR